MTIRSLPLLSIIIFLSVVTSFAQRDYLTAEEIELVRDNQQIDKRIAVLIGAIDRRFASLKVEVARPGARVKVSGSWGPLPEGTQREIHGDIRGLLQKAIDDIDSLAERPDSAIIIQEPKGKKAKPPKQLFSEAVRSLAAAAASYLSVLRSESERTNDRTTLGHIESSISMCEQIIEAASKLPPDADKTKSKN
jgi:hypothetical protein